MGSKKNKVKKIFSPPQAPISPEPVNPVLDDDELMDDLLAQLDSRDKNSKEESAAVVHELQLDKVADSLEQAPKQDSKARHKARQARRAAALAEQFAPSDAAAEARLEKEAREEEIAINRTCEQLGVKMHEINPDGHCLFSAIADQLELLGVLPPSSAKYEVVRAAAAEYMRTHPDDFLPFLPSAVGEDGSGATDGGLMTPAEYQNYCNTIRSTAVWGGEPEIQALSRFYNIPIHVIQGGKPHVVVHTPTGTTADGNGKDERVVRISYHRRMYGLGEHYNSLRPSRSAAIANGFKAIFSSSPPRS